MISFVMSLIMFGGFYDWNVTITGVCILMEIILYYWKKKPIYQRKKNYVMWIPGMILLWMIAVSFWALDISDHFLGIIRGVVLLFWFYLCFQMEEKEKEKIFNLVPRLGAVMVGIGVISLAEERWAAYFWQARRFGGCFQYPNTCALFLMIGLVLQVGPLLQKKEDGGNIQEDIGVQRFLKNLTKKNVVSVVITVSLLWGLFLTGCRSVLLLLLCWGVYTVIKRKNLRKPLIIVGAGSFLVAYGYGLVLGDHQNIARIFTIFESNSTIYGRILYAIDALNMVKKHPLGLGYMGYYYYQPVVQTGVYTTRFVHNDFLQVLVDYGIPAFILVVFYLGYQLWKGQQSSLRKELLVLMIVASLMDFHLQYLSVLMLFVLCLDLGQKEHRKKRKELRENYFFITIGILAGIYFTIAFGASYFKNYSVSLQLLPSYTQAQIHAMEECTKKEEAVKLADEILSHNVYVAQAYHTKIYASVMEEDFLQAAEYIREALAIKRYDTESYRGYDALLDEMIEKSKDRGWMQEAEILKKEKEELPKKLAALEKETHPLAFKIRNSPQFVW